jgi:hypothetical protein
MGSRRSKLIFAETNRSAWLRLYQKSSSLEDRNMRTSKPVADRRQYWSILARLLWIGIIARVAVRGHV